MSEKRKGDESLATSLPSKRQKRMWEYEVKVKVKTREEGEMLMRTLQVDEEVRPDRVQRVFYVESSGEGNGGVFACKLSAGSLRDLRTSVQSFYDMLILSTRTVATFSSLA
jgi:hypothetical protein